MHPFVGIDMAKNNQAFDRAVRQWVQLLSDQYVVTSASTIDQYARTTAPGEGTRCRAVLYPESTQQVQEIVKIAGAYGQPIYPISCGKNWGYGDACAPTDGQVIVDLKRMNRIVEVNTDLAYAVLEPGVTQGQLSAYLAKHQTGLWMDCTGAGLSASVVGNTLDRGIGHTPYGDHYLNTCGMEIVLSDGRVLNTGFGHYANAKASRVYRYGIGPVLDGLFSQSNLGIVTRIGLWLMPVPEYFCAFAFKSMRQEDLPDIVDRLRPLRVQGLLRSTIHIANDLRVFSSRARYPWDLAEGQTPLPEGVRHAMQIRYGVGAWNGLGAIYGTKRMVKSICKKLRAAMKPYRVVFIDDRRLALAHRLQSVLGWFGKGHRLSETLETVKPVYGLLKGEPTDEPLAGTGWRVRGEDPPRAEDPLDHDAGLMWVSPVLPMSGVAVREVTGIADPIYQKHGFEPLVTFTMVTERAMLYISNLSFDKRDLDEMARANACYNELMDDLIRRGYIPYRTGIQGYSKLTNRPSVYWEVAKQLKEVLDPVGVISPKRYIPISHNIE